jgi:hypothetical protein
MTRKGFFTTLIVGGLASRVIAAPQEKPPHTIDVDERLRLMMEFDKHWLAYLKGLFGCPPTAREPEDCTITPRNDASEFLQCRSMAKKIFDLRDVEH